MALVLANPGEKVVIEKKRNLARKYNKEIGILISSRRYIQYENHEGMIASIKRSNVEVVSPATGNYKYVEYKGGLYIKNGNNISGNTVVQ